MLELHDVNTFYGPNHILQSLNLEVKQGEIVTLLGANAAGKTTTMKTIFGLVRPKTGTVTFKGERIDNVGTDQVVMRGLALVPEARRVFPRMSVFENLQMGAFLNNDRATIDQEMDRVYTLFPRLKERAKQVAGTLSGGEQQMLAVARALAREVKLLLLDEPYEGLAPVIVKEIERIIYSIRDRGITTIIVEQNAVAALRLADRAVILDSGELVFTGGAKELLDNEALRNEYLAI